LFSERGSDIEKVGVEDDEQEESINEKQSEKAND
jgi:hypothetical protein